MFNLFNKGCCGQTMNQGCMEREIVEPTINKCIEKEFYVIYVRRVFLDSSVGRASGC